MATQTIRQGGDVAVDDAATVEMRDVVDLFEELKREVDRCCEDEIRHQQMVAQAVERRKWQERKLLTVLSMINDPAGLRRERARQPYDAGLKDALTGHPWRDGAAATEGEIGKWLRKCAEWCDGGWCLYEGTPAVFLPGYPTDYPTVHGAALLAAVRRVLEIPVKSIHDQPKEAVIQALKARTGNAATVKLPKNRIRDRRKVKNTPPAPKVTAPILPVCTNFGPKDAPWTRDDLSHALSVGELKTGLVKRVFAHDGVPYGVYAWEWPDGPEPQRFTLFNLVPVGEWQGPKPQTYDQRRIRDKKVDPDHPGGLLVAGPDGTQYVIDDTRPLVVIGEKRGGEL